MKEKTNYLFFNQKQHPLGSKQLDRRMGWKLISDWCKEIGLKGNYGGHTLRKTWGYQARVAGVPIELIQHKLNHYSLSVTKRYLGITDDELEKICNDLDL